MNDEKKPLAQPARAWPFSASVPRACESVAISRATPADTNTGVSGNTDAKSHATRPGLAWHALFPSDLDAVHALHLASVDRVGPQVVKHEQPDFFDGILRGRGSVLGVFSDGELIAYGVLQNVLGEDDDPRARLGLGPVTRIVKLAGAAVADAWRGRGLQRELIARRIAMAGHAALYATVAPDNPFSLANMLDNGFSIRAIEKCYGVYMRCLMMHDRTRAPLATDTCEIVPIRDVPRQRLLLSQGWQGIACAGSSAGERGSALEIRYVPGLGDKGSGA